VERSDPNKIKITAIAQGLIESTKAAPVITGKLKESVIGGEQTGHELPILAPFSFF